jgi:hypothetical protein
MWLKNYNISRRRSIVFVYVFRRHAIGNTCRVHREGDNKFVKECIHILERHIQQRHYSSRPFLKLELTCTNIFDSCMVSILSVKKTTISLCLLKMELYAPNNRLIMMIKSQFKIKMMANDDVIKWPWAIYIFYVNLPPTSLVNTPGTWGWCSICLVWLFPVDHTHVILEHTTYPAVKCQQWVFIQTV